MLINLNQYRATKLDFFQSWYGTALYRLMCKKITVANMYRFNVSDCHRICKMLQYVSDRVIMNIITLSKLRTGSMVVNYISNGFSCYHQILHRDVNLYWQIVADDKFITLMLFQNTDPTLLITGLRYSFDNRNIELDNFIYPIDNHNIEKPPEENR